MGNANFNPSMSMPGNMNMNPNSVNLPPRYPTQLDQQQQQGPNTSVVQQQQQGAPGNGPVPGGVQQHQIRAELSLTSVLQPRACTSDPG